MLRNYFKIAWRNLFRNKGFSLTNLLGLTIGITPCNNILSALILSRINKGMKFNSQSLGASVLFIRRSAINFSTKYDANRNRANLRAALFPALGSTLGSSNNTSSIR